MLESGQAIWYDGIERRLLTSGELKRLIDEDELRGVTSNPTIFEKAIDSSGDYSDQLCEQAERQKSASEIYEALAVRDIQMAADLLAPVFDKTDGTDGFVSLECSPLLAHDTAAAIKEERAVLARLEGVGISLDEVTGQVLDEGVSLFAKSFEKLMKAIQSRRSVSVSTCRPPASMASAIVPKRVAASTC